MRWSLRLGKVSGVPVEVHWLFVLLLPWAAVQGWANEGLWGIPFAFGLLLLIFACVLIHEIGHTLHAQALGIPVRRILLLPIGGLAELARLPERPTDELRVALAGPAANLGLALMWGALSAVWFLAGRLPVRETLHHMAQTTPPSLLTLMLYLTSVNAGITLFNLLPAFPMDGGRILRSLLALRLKRATATRLVAGLGWILAGLFFVAGLGAAPSFGASASVGLMLAGVMILFGAGFEEAVERNRLSLSRIPARAAVRQPTVTLAPTDRVTADLAALTFSVHSALPVVVSSRLVGLVTRQDLSTALQRADRTGEAYTIAHIMRTRFPYVRADEDLWRAQQILATSDVSALPVLEGERLHGMLTAADIRAARFEPPSSVLVDHPTFNSGGNSTL